MATSNNTPNTGALTPPATESSAAIKQPTTGDAGALVTDAVLQEPPRVLAGLTAARLVWYFLLDLSVRPFLILDAGDGSGKVLGVLFFNGSLDERQLPVPLVSDPSGHKPTLSVVVEADYTEDAEAGKWRWPERQPVMAAGVDADAINVAVAAMMEPVIKRVVQSFKDDLADKLEAQTAKVQELLDANGELLKDTVAKIQHPVLPGIASAESAGAASGGPALVADPEPQTGEQTQATQAADAGTQVAEQSGGKETATAGS